MAYRALHGVNLTGWLTLEAWVTPTLFADSGALEESALIDSIGRDEYRRRLDAHRAGFVRQADFNQIAARGFNAVRLPVPWYVFGGRGPATSGRIGCIEHVDAALDWAGQTDGVIDTDTGKIIPVYLFVAVLPYSGYAYTEGFLDMKQEAWINAHVHAYQYFGGITRLLVPDNLKTGVVKNTKDETVINKTYQEMAIHYGTAILPARPRSPKDKAAVEGTVGNVSTWILAALRNQQFFSLEEINEAIWDKLYDFNHKPFQKKEGSRAASFEEEKVFLLPLPDSAFEVAVWKIATVQYNYHISVDKQNYSVPYSPAGPTTTGGISNADKRNYF
jgi:hypothetical protein